MAHEKECCPICQKRETEPEAAQPQEPPHCSGSMPGCTRPPDHPGSCVYNPPPAPPPAPEYRAIELQPIVQHDGEATPPRAIEPQEHAPAAPSPARELPVATADDLLDALGYCPKEKTILRTIVAMKLDDLRAEVRQETMRDVLDKWDALATLYGLTGLAGLGAGGDCELLKWLREQVEREGQ